MSWSEYSILQKWIYVIVAVTIHKPPITQMAENFGIQTKSFSKPLDLYLSMPDVFSEVILIQTF